VTITVLDVAGFEATRDGAASVRRFLTGETVGARLVEGAAYELPSGERLAVEPSDRHQVVYVTAGEVSADFQGELHRLRPGGGVYCEPGEGCELEAAGDAAFYRFTVARS
jgi:glyoxylate utilization-related uncharacterized protein